MPTVSALLQARDIDGIALSDAEVNGIVFTLLGAGYIPPAQAVAVGILRLLRDADATLPFGCGLTRRSSRRR